jgi:hypothetical protein
LCATRHAGFSFLGGANTQPNDHFRLPSCRSGISAEWREWIVGCLSEHGLGTTAYSTFKTYKNLRWTSSLGRWLPLSGCLYKEPRNDRFRVHSRRSPDHEALRFLTAGVWSPADSERFVSGLALPNDGVEYDH